MNEPVVWHACREELPQTVASNTKPSDSNDLQLLQRYVDDIDKVIEDIQTIFGIYQKRDIETIFKYIKDIIVILFLSMYQRNIAPVTLRTPKLYSISRKY